MKGIITYCVLIIWMKQVASYPFPEEYLGAYQQPPISYQYSNFGQSHNQNLAPRSGYVQTKQQYYGSYRPETRSYSTNVPNNGQYSNAQYPRNTKIEYEQTVYPHNPNTVSNAALQDALEQQSSVHPTQGYGSYIVHSQPAVTPQIQGEPEPTLSEDYVLRGQSSLASPLTVRDEVNEQRVAIARQAAIQEEIDQIREQQNLNERFASRDLYENRQSPVRKYYPTDTSQKPILTTVSQAYTPAHSYQQVRQPYYPVNQQAPPLINSPSTLFRDTPEEPTGYAVPIKAEELDKVNAEPEVPTQSTPTQQVSDATQQGYNMNNILSRYPSLREVISSTKHKKRYLVVHPDGTVEHVDQLDTVAEKHPNYVLLNAGTIIQHTVPEEASETTPKKTPVATGITTDTKNKSLRQTTSKSSTVDTTKPYPQPVRSYIYPSFSRPAQTTPIPTQGNPATAPKSPSVVPPTATKTPIKSITLNSDNTSNTTPTKSYFTSYVPTLPKQLPPPAFDTPIATTTPTIASTTSNLSAPTTTRVKIATTETNSSVIPTTPSPSDTSNEVEASIVESDTQTLTTSTTAESTVSETEVSATAELETSDSLTKTEVSSFEEPTVTPDPVIPTTPSYTASPNDVEASDVESDTQTLTSSTTAESTVTETEVSDAVELETSDSQSKTEVSSFEDISQEKQDDLQEEDETLAESPLPDSPDSSENDEITVAEDVSPSQQPVPNYTFDVVYPEAGPSGQPPILIDTGDPDFFTKLMGDQPYALVYFFQIPPQPVAEKDTKTTMYSNGTIIEEVTETEWNTLDGVPRVTTTVNVVDTESQIWK